MILLKITISLIIRTWTIREDIQKWLIIILYVIIYYYIIPLQKNFQSVMISHKNCFLYSSAIPLQFFQDLLGYSNCHLKLINK